MTNRAERLAKVLKELNSDKPGSVMTGEDLKKIRPGVVPTGVPSVDRILGGGFPRSLITHLYGEKSCGKTTLCLQAIGNLHQSDKEALALVANCEGYFSGFSMAYIESFGVDPKRLHVVTRAYSEETLSICKELIKSRLYDIFVWDSIAGVKSSDELNKSLSDVEKIGSHARLVQRFTADVVNLTAPDQDPDTKKMVSHRTAMVFLNQKRSTISQYSPDSTTGGRSVSYFASIELEVFAPKGDYLYYTKDKKLVEAIEGHTVEKKELQEKNHIGKKLHFTVKKQRCNDQEGRTVYVDFYNRHLNIPSETGFQGFGYDIVSNMIDEGLLHGVIQASGSWITYAGDKVQGRDALCRMLRDDKKKTNKLMKELSQHGKAT